MSDGKIHIQYPCPAVWDADIHEIAHPTLLARSRPCSTGVWTVAAASIQITHCVKNTLVSAHTMMGEDTQLRRYIIAITTVGNLQLCN